MIQDRIARLEATLAATPDLPAAAREELLSLLAELKTELATLHPVPDEQARSITASMDAAFSRAAQRPGAAFESTPLDELRASVAGFEASHPRLVAVVDRIALTLSNMGI